MSDLPYPFCRTDEAPFYTVATGNGEYVWVVLAGDYRQLQADQDLLYAMACDLYADLNPQRTRSECESDVLKWYEYSKKMTPNGE